MGKWTDKLYITHGEWKSGEFHGGLSKARQKEAEAERAFKKLPFDHCALSLQPFNVPVCTKEGMVFDFEEIERYIRLHCEADGGGCRCPISGRPLRLGDLVRLHFYRNPAGEHACPVTGRVFAENTKIMANLRNGRVYSAEAVDQMCESGLDFATDESCKKMDFVAITDPEFAGMTRNCAGRLEELKREPPRDSFPEEPCATGAGPRVKTSTGKVAAALTSTSLAPVLRQELRDVDRETVPKPLRNAKVVIRTTHGDLDAVLFAPMMPITVFNYVARAKRGDYCNSHIFGITSSAILAGICTNSDLPCNVKESPHRSLIQSEKGTMGMCTDKDGSTTQFYMALAPSPQSNSVNRIFGRLELANKDTREAFARLASIQCDAGGNPLEYAAVLDIIIMFDPFTREESESLKRARPARAQLDAKPAVGKYLKL